MEKKLKKENPEKNPKKGFNFKLAISELEQINSQFQRPDMDLDEGLKNLKRGQELVIKCQEYLSNAENEFEKIKESFNADLLDSGK